MPTVWLWWSSGKDSAWALHKLREQPDLQVTALVTTVNRAFDRVAMHATRSELVGQQAEAAGLELQVMEIPHPCPNEVYEEGVHRVLAQARDQGVSHMAFGDLFLADIRTYRQQLLQGSGIEPLFPLWGRDTYELARSMVEGGLRAVVTCIDPKVLPRPFAGREFDAAFLADLPAGVDPCGEHGEFHTFAYEGPMFDRPLPVKRGEVVEREGFMFADVVPLPGSPRPS